MIRGLVRRSSLNLNVQTNHIKKSYDSLQSCFLCYTQSFTIAPLHLSAYLIFIDYYQRSDQKLERKGTKAISAFPSFGKLSFEAGSWNLSGFSEAFSEERSRRVSAYVPSSERRAYRDLGIPVDYGFWISCRFWHGCRRRRRRRHFFGRPCFA